MLARILSNPFHTGDEQAAVMNSERVASRRRSRSPCGRSHDQKRHERKRSSSPSKRRPLPFNAKHLDKRDIAAYQPLLSSYLDIQKGLALEELDADESRGRWKSFVKKWNRGELAEGWYEPAALQRAAAASYARPVSATKPSEPKAIGYTQGEISDMSDEEDDIGPSLPGKMRAPRQASRRAGPAVPSMPDLELRRELAQEDAEHARETLRDERRMHGKQAKEQLDELQPRAEPGTKERQMEKKREVASANRQFALAGEGGGMADVAEGDLMGDDADGLGGFKRQKKEADRKKNERELKRAEIMRARREEREEKARMFKEKEQETLSGLIALAKKRFG